MMCRKNTLLKAHKLEAPPQWNYQEHIGTGGFADVFLESITRPVFGTHLCAVKRMDYPSGYLAKTRLFFFFFFGVYTPNQPKAMRRPRSLPLKGSVHPRENGLHKRPAFQTKEISKGIPPSATTPPAGPSPIKVCLRLHAPSGPLRTYMNLPPPRPFRPSLNKQITQSTTPNKYTSYQEISVGQF